MLFHFTAQYAPEGDIGRYPDKRIAAGMAWHGNPGKLLAALASAGWLDTCAQARWVVHGWSEHADRSVLARLLRQGKTPLQSNHEVTGKVCTESKTLIAPARARASALPEPQPEPNGCACGDVGKTHAASRARHPSPPPPAGDATVAMNEKCRYPAFDQNWAQSDDAITRRYPTTDPPLCRQIIEAAVQAHIGAATNGEVLTDKILAKMIGIATRETQKSAKLYLTTLPVVVINQLRESARENHHP